MSTIKNNIVNILDNFASKDIKDFVISMISKIVSKIKNDEVLTSMQSFFVIIVTLRHELTSFKTKSNFIDVVNSKLRKSLHCYKQACLSKSVDDRLNFSDQLHKSYNTSLKYKTSKDFAKTTEYKNFVEKQSSRTLQSFLNVTQVNVTLDKNSKKDLQVFRLAKSFVEYCDKNDDIVIIEKYALSKE